VWAAGLYWLAEEEGQTLSPFKPRGAIMPAHELKVGGERVIWTLGGYLRLTHTSADNFKLGVGYIGDLPRESTMVF